MNRVAIILVALVALVPRGASTAGPSSPTIEEFLEAGTPTEVVAAKKAERIAWTAYEQDGLRNVYTAAGPAFTPVRLTNVTKDDGIELSDVSISDDGGWWCSCAVRSRTATVGSPIRRRIPTARRARSGPRHRGRRRVEGGRRHDAALSPDGRAVAYAKDGQIYAYAIGPVRRTSSGARETARQSMGRATARRCGRQTDRSSPSSATASITRSSASTTLRTRSVTFLSPSVDHDTSPTWSPDGKHVAFIRRPGTPFGQQAHQGREASEPRRSGVQPARPRSAVARRLGRSGGEGARTGTDGERGPACSSRPSPAATPSHSWTPTSRAAKVTSSGTTSEAIGTSTR